MTSSEMEREDNVIIYQKASKAAIIAILHDVKVNTFEINGKTEVLSKETATKDASGYFRAEKSNSENIHWMVSTTEFK